MVFLGLLFAFCHSDVCLSAISILPSSVIPNAPLSVIPNECEGSPSAKNPAEKPGAQRGWPAAQEYRLPCTPFFRRSAGRPEMLGGTWLWRSLPAVEITAVLQPSKNVFQVLRFPSCSIDNYNACRYNTGHDKIF
jgi:hypothetical protein